MDYPIQTISQLRPILQGFRKAAGLTQAALAARLGVTQQTYARLEADPAAISVERFFRVLRVLGIELTMTQDDAELTKAHAPVAKSKKVSVPAKRQAKRAPAAALHQEETPRSHQGRALAAARKKRENW